MFPPYTLSLNFRWIPGRNCRLKFPIQLQCKKMRFHPPRQLDSTHPDNSILPTQTTRSYPPRQLDSTHPDNSILPTQTTTPIVVELGFGTVRLVALSGSHHVALRDQDQGDQSAECCAPPHHCSDDCRVANRCFCFWGKGILYHSAKDHVF